MIERASCEIRKSKSVGCACQLSGSIACSSGVSRAGWAAHSLNPIGSARNALANHADFPAMSSLKVSTTLCSLVGKPWPRTQHVFINAGCDIFDVVAHHQRRDAGRNLDVFETALQFASRLGERLAALLRRQARNLVEVLLQQPLELEEVLDALDWWRSPPAGEGCLRGAYCFVDLVTR